MTNKNLSHATSGFIAGTILIKYIFVVVLGLSGILTFANPTMATKEEIGMFKNSTTCVVLENGSISYNVYIKDAVQKYWKTTNFEFIDQAEFEKRRFNTKYSFLALMKGVFDKDPGGISYNYLSLVLGSSATDMTNMPEICSIPLSYSDDNSMDYGYAIPSIVKFMQIHAKNIENKRFSISIQGFAFYNGSTSFKDKVLLLNKNMMAPDVNTTDKIALVYPYYVKLLSTSDIEAELKSNPANTLFNFHVGPTMNAGSGKCFDMIFDVEGNLYYYSDRKITNENVDGFNCDDFKRIKHESIYVKL